MHLGVSFDWKDCQYKIEKEIMPLVRVPEIRLESHQFSFFSMISNSDSFSNPYWSSSKFS